MKIFNNGGTKVYVQKLDMEYLLDIYGTIPIFASKYINSERYNFFIEFTNPEEIEYFKSIDWLIDYRDYEKKDVKEIEKELKELYDDIMKGKIPLQEKKIKTYIYKFLLDISHYRLGIDEIAFPLVPDTEAFFIEDDKFIIRKSLGTYNLLIEKKNGELMSYKDQTPDDLINAAKSFLYLNYNIGNPTRGTTLEDMHLSEDRKYYIYRIIFREYTKVDGKNKGFVKKLLSR